MALEIGSHLPLCAKDDSEEDVSAKAAESEATIFRHGKILGDFPSELGASEIFALRLLLAGHILYCKRL